MTSLTVWARRDDPPQSISGVVLWQSFLPNEAPLDWVSLPDEVHEHRISLRKAYQAWLRRVGSTSFRGRSLAHHMRLAPGLSYWWMALPANFSLEPNSPVYDVVRLLALTRLIDERGATYVRIEADDSGVARLLSRWARDSGRPFIVGSTSGSPRRGARAAAYRLLPPLAALRVLVGAAAVPRRAVPQVNAGEAAGIMVVDYLAHLGPRTASAGEFDPRYWGPLVDLLQAQPTPVTWLHLPANPLGRQVAMLDRRILARLAQGSPGQRHRLLLDRLSVGVLLRAARDYVRITWRGLTTPGHAYDETESRVPTRAAVAVAKRDEFYGRTAMLNALWISLFASELRAAGPQRMGIFLMENQPWEMAFIAAWRNAGNGPLIGVLHTTALFWSTRLFKDPDAQWTADDEAMPSPDVVVVNGPDMLAQVMAGGYPMDRVVEAEALRFLYSGTLDKASPVAVPPRVLVMGEYSPTATDHLVDLVTRALPRGASNVKFRPHPAADSTPAVVLAIDRSESLVDALKCSDIVVCGSLSSVAVDAVLAGRSTVIVADPTLFRSSPAEGLVGVTYVRDDEDMRRALAMTARSDRRPAPFHMDSDLKRWRALIEQVVAPPE